MTHDVDLVKLKFRGTFRARAITLGLGLCAGAACFFASEQAHACQIVLGESGNSWTYSSAQTSVPAASFIRSTSTGCMWEVFNHSNYVGPMVIIGAYLTERIRAGTDGVEKKDSGGGDTWRIRSIRPIPTFGCSIRIGGNGIRMTYDVASAIPAMPGMDKIDWYNCAEDLILFNHSNFGSPNRVLAGFFSGPTMSLPFRARSMIQVN